MHITQYFTFQHWSSDKISDELELPKKNEFIATNFDLFPQDENVS